MIFILFLSSIFVRQKKSDNCNTISWSLYTQQLKPPQSNCFQFLNSIVMNCHVSENGGCIFIQNKKMDILISGSSFIHSQSEQSGGALFLDIQKSDISNCCIHNCTSKGFASSISVKGVNELVDNLITFSAITSCACNKSTFEIIEGQQNVLSVNISNNYAKSTGSGIYIQTNQATSAFLLNVISNIGETTLDFQYSMKVSDVMKSNFVNNTNTHLKGYILISSGQWNIKHSVFLRNNGTNFLHFEDEIQFINCSFDMPIPSNGKFIVNNPHQVVDCPLNQISDLYHGYCPAFGTPTKPMPSPTPGKTIIAPQVPTTQQSSTITYSYTNTISATSIIPIQKKQGFFGLLLLPISIIGLAALSFMICSSLIRPSFDHNEENKAIMTSMDEHDIVDPIEITVLDDEEEEEVVADNGNTE